MGTYTGVEVLPLDEVRQFESTKYILGSSTITHSNDSEVSLKSDVDFPKRSKPAHPSHLLIATLPIILTS